MSIVSQFDIANKISREPYYSTQLGSAYLGNSLELMAELPDESVDLICTSPPFALVRKKEYGNVDAHQYVEWFKTFAREFYRILKPQGSLFIDIGGTWLKGFPVRSLYHFELVIELCQPKSKGGLGFFLAQEIFWYNPAKLPTPAEWVTVRRERVKDAVNTVWWLSKDPHPKANNKRVLRPYSEAMKNLLKNGYEAKLRPSGHDISTKFQTDRGGAIPPNIIADTASSAGTFIGQPVLGEFNWILDHDLAQPVNVIAASNTASNDYYQRRCKEAGIKPHPARFPQALPEFAIALCTEPGDLVLDPFAGSNMTGRVAETLDRRWLAFELDENYIKASQFRFEADAPLVVTPLKDRKYLKTKALDLAPDYREKSSTIDDKNSHIQLDLFQSPSNDMPEQKLKFTYGHQFEPKTMHLPELMQLCKANQPDRRVLQDEIAKGYYSSHSNQNDLQKGENRSKLAMNTFLSLRAYKLVESINDDDWQYQLTDIANQILEHQTDADEVATIFARHILTSLTGMSLLKAVEAINSRGDRPKLDLIGYELEEMGYSLSPNAIYVSTMRQWLEKAGVFEKTYEINWDRVYDILELDKDYIDDIYTLTSEQKYFLLAMLQMSITELTKWNDIANYAVSVYKVRFPSKSFVKDIIQPLVEFGLISTEKTTGGRGAKPNLVKLTEKAQRELLSQLLEAIAALTEISQTELNRSFEDVVNDLDHPDKHIKGKALELLAIWMIRLTSLRFTKWRKRDYETGQGEVDVLAASDRFVYHRWQIQCKNTKRVDVEVLAKEVGMTFVTGADVVMIVTTGEFTRDAFQYAYRMMEISRYYMVLIQKEDIEAIKADRTNIIKILDRRARRVFAKKELGLTDDAVDEIESEEDSLTEFEGTLAEE
ncbi:DNA methylase [Planktothricoides sp. SR001]|uniref:DNA methyltransferase n=1 Tax=Planktothricoides sp. SR001 TaxID=1705388 RepID=UPI0006BF1242|nr:DNA methyltransferase [Planktothricoides sp. SR001]KOR35899.1 DNA methylase [Planktothricoides sp. SR001]